jgi:MFS family permease
MVSFVDSAGTGLFLAGSALFFTRALGLTANQVGFALSMAGVAGLLCAVPVGRLADRFGSKRILVALQVWRGLGFLAYPFVQDFTMFLVVACLIGAGEWAIGPVVQAVVGAAEEGDSQVRTMAAMTTVRNVGFTIGALLATLVIASNSTTGYRALVLADAASFFVAAAMLARLPLARETASGRHERAEQPTVRVRDPRYLLLTALNGVLYLHTVLLTIGLPLWIASHTRAPAALVGAVVVLNTVLAIALPVLLSRGADEVVPAASRQRRAGWCLAACCVLIGVTGQLGPVAASALALGAVVALTLGEIWQSVGAWGLSYGLSPESQRNYYLSVYSLGATGATVVGPILVTFAVIRGGAAGWLCLAGVFVVAGLAVPAIARGHAPAARRLSLERSRA